MISFRMLSALFLLKLKNQFGITFMAYSSKFLVNKEVSNTETHLHVQENYIQLPGFGFNKSRRLYRGNNEQH